MQKINAQKPKNNQKPGGKDKHKQKGKQQKKPIEEEFDEDQLNELDDLDDDDIDMFTDDIDKDGDLFWKLEVSHNEPSTMDVPESFDGIVCITQASFGESVNKGSRTVVCCTTPLSNEPVPICVLNQGTHETHPLNLKFSSPSEFSLKGQQPSTVYLTGYVEPALDNLHDMEDDDDYDIPEHVLSKMKRRFGEEDEEEDEAEQFEPAAKKRKIEPPKGKKAIENKKEAPQTQTQAQTQAEEKKPAQTTGKKNQKKEANKKPQTESAKPQTEESKTPIEVPKTPAEAPKKETPSLPQTPQDKQNTTTSTEAASTNNETPQSVKLSKSQRKNLKKKEKQANGKQTEDKSKEEATPKEEKTQTETATPVAKPNETPAKNGAAENEGDSKDKKKKEAAVEKKLPSGIDIKDIKVGTGPEIKNGQSLHIMYAGQLATKTVFDKHLTGSGFAYKFGSEEGIKGWHLGMKGMRMGGKRRIVVPPKFAFGVDGNPAKGVPGDATVTYTIEVLEEPKQ